MSITVGEHVLSIAEFAGVKVPEPMPKAEYLLELSAYKTGLTATQSGAPAIVLTFKNAVDGEHLGKFATRYIALDAQGLGHFRKIVEDLGGEWVQDIDLRTLVGRSIYGQVGIYKRDGIELNTVLASRPVE